MAFSHSVIHTLVTSPLMFHMVSFRLAYESDRKSHGPCVIFVIHANETLHKVRCKIRVFKESQFTQNNILSP